ncbi:DUF4956 domain-containing protein [Acidaminobacter sp.]|uniref:DUF4956 domain-containing protein n=1 Tax=Acidaminobacter sp. TaxID=1872102 RepID=UPI00255F8E1E|nr:DUF4956 domain-containing protein [Acidaminobacter sp.]MDK9711323.1 DUF4956 domain-containing protein [Acidaminobacter sp.]
MLNSLFSTTSTAAAATSLTIESLIIATLASLLLGLGVAGVYMFRNTYSKSFAVSLVLLPAMIQIVIMMVNGNVGAGVAVMGAFSLVRFRSIPGSAREISNIFLAMAIGLTTGMGYVWVALMFLVIIGCASMLLTVFRFGEQPLEQREKELKITIPENLDYTGVFDDLFHKYTKKAELILVKTTNMGSLYELKYHIYMREAGTEKAFMDELRCRNGNLSISYGRVSSQNAEL